MRIARYWELPEEPDLELEDETALERFSELIEDAVRLRLHADVPVAITLSGGIDSSVVTVAASRVTGCSVKTFTSRLPGDPAVDESRHAAHVAATRGADAHYGRPSLDGALSADVALPLHPAL